MSKTDSDLSPDELAQEIKKTVPYQNLVLLIEQRCESVSEFGKRIGVSQSQAAAYAGSKPRKRVGNIMRKRIEKAFGLPSNYLSEKVQTTFNFDFDSSDHPARQRVRNMIAHPSTRFLALKGDDFTAAVEDAHSALQAVYGEYKRQASLFLDTLDPYEFYRFRVMDFHNLTRAAADGLDERRSRMAMRSEVCANRQLNVLQERTYLDMDWVRIDRDDVKAMDELRNVLIRVSLMNDMTFDALIRTMSRDDVFAAIEEESKTLYYISSLNSAVSPQMFTMGREKYGMARAFEPDKDYQLNELHRIVESDPSAQDLKIVPIYCFWVTDPETLDITPVLFKTAVTGLDNAHRAELMRQLQARSRQVMRIRDRQRHELVERSDHEQLVAQSVGVKDLIGQHSDVLTSKISHTSGVLKGV